MTSLQSVWQELASQYSEDQELIQELWEEIRHHYSASQRPYHNLTHLGYMLEKAQGKRAAIKDWDSLLFAVFYHHLVYDISRKDNEQRSAAMASKRLIQLGVPPEKIERVLQEILATEHHEANGDNDTRYLLDFDLAILGAPEDVYQAYAQNILKEYSQYPALTYKQGRKKVLQYFLDRDRIFQTEDFFHEYEEQARENLQMEMNTY